jgi:abnormal spindle-like microcephaly-associated protein
VRDVILRVEAQIDLGKLRLRGVRDGFDVDPSGINAKGGGSFMEDTSLREAFRDALGSYGVFWLRAAVDVIVGVPGDGRDVLGDGEDELMRDAKRERLERQRLVAALMRDEEIELAYGSEGRGVAPFAEGYAEALAGTVLKRTLLLVFLLDRAQAGTGTAAPLLFRRGARLKTSGDVIRAALQASCHGEGDVLRRLGHYGYKLHHAQEPVREYDFRTENLALELRDGVRLCRLVDTLGNARGDASALARASFPAQARVAKRRNVALALETAVETFGVEGLRGVNPDDVVDGNLAATATTLYHLRVHFQGPAALGDWDEVHRETESWRERRRAQISVGVFRRKFFKDTLASAAEAREKVLQRLRASDEDAVAEAMFAEELADARLKSTVHESNDDDGESDGEANELTVVRRCELALLRWARAVAATRGVEVSDFSGSFADGVALCAVIHAYAPELVHLREIVRVDSGSESVGFRTRTRTTAHEAVASNFALAKRAVDVLRGTESTVPPAPV